MKTMSWEEIDKDWAKVKERCKTFVAQEEAEAYARYCIGHNVRDVADRIGVSQATIQERLDLFAITQAIGGDRQSVTPTEMSVRDVRKIKEQFAPKVVVEISTAKDGSGEKTISSITGKDAEDFSKYVDHYKMEGHKDLVAVRLAEAEWAAESAIEAGVIKEDVNKRNERVNRILFPEDGKDTFEIDLKMHMARVKAAASFLDNAKVNYLRRKSTCEMVESANEKWVEQVDRILNLHPNHQ